MTIGWCAALGNLGSSRDLVLWAVDAGIINGTSAEKQVTKR